MFRFLLFCILATRTFVAALSPIENKTVCIIGGGPCGLFLANLLLRQNPTVRVHVIERAPRSGPPDTKAFGFGIGRRLKRCLEAVPDLSDRVEAVSAPISSREDLRICGRSALCEAILSQIEEQHSHRFHIDFQTEARQVDWESRQLHVSGDEVEKVVSYDLLVGADGINSRVRHWITERESGPREEHFLHPSQWKALRLPPQPGLEGAFSPLTHSKLGGALIPRFPEGHTILMFWRGSTDNPPGVETAHDLCQLLSSALQDSVPRANIVKNLIWKRSETEFKPKEREITFDYEEIDRCLNCRAGREHFMKLDRYHHGESTVLLGDAAHGMYSMLGQGCACGFESSQTLSKCLDEHESIGSALRAYSAVAVPEGHAASDLNLLSHATFGKGLAQVLAVPFLTVQALRGKMVFKRVGDPVSFQEVLNENKVAVSLARLVWKRERLPFENRFRVSV